MLQRVGIDETNELEKEVDGKTRLKSRLSCGSPALMVKVALIVGNSRLMKVRTGMERGNRVFYLKDRSHIVRTRVVDITQRDIVA